MLDILRNLGSEYQDAEDARLYGPNPMGGFPFNIGGHPDSRPQRNYLGDLATGKYRERKRRERKAGQALVDYFGIG